ncbi:hypothetical protein POTOM_036559 [Populus tomentosa]|uniref:Protein kinase domain-containing protein n=1 Tax=Populus tomentosa TaxID=118781 RepID=A0A8X8CN39_POPTO|nr:hypothetical protein POTOM_036559 [Populus tomentosa]
MIKFHDAFEDENNVYVVMDFDSILSDEDAPMRIIDFGLSDFVRPGSLFAQKYILIPIVGIIIDLIDVLWVLSRCFLLQDMDKLSSEGNVLASGGNKAF